MNRGRPLAPALAVAAAALVAGGCSQKQVDTTSKDRTSTASAQTATQTAPQATAQASPKPNVQIPPGAPPRKLVVRDLKPGRGPAAKAGDQLTVNYVGKAYSTKKEFDNSYDRGQPFPFQLGGGQVIPGWDQGLVGMKVGGRRELVIPPGLGYGSQGSPPAIKPNETLVFVIDLLARQ